MGFSFGAYVQAKVAESLTAANKQATSVVLIGTPFGTIGGERSYDTPAVPRSTLVIHGEKDEIVPLQQVLDWARPQELPVVVLPGANHFFNGKLVELQSTLKHHLEALAYPSHRPE
jgi:hypothetical protein